MEALRGHRARMKMIDDYLTPITPEDLEQVLIEGGAKKEQPDCNKCIHVSITEEEQQQRNNKKFELHYCTLYNARVLHGTRTLKHCDSLGPCDECNSEYNINFKIKGENV